MQKSKLMTSLEIYNSSSDEELYVRLSFSEVFISLHLDDRKSAGVYFKKRDFSPERVEALVTQMAKYIDVDSSKIEMKIIGAKNLFDDCTNAVKKFNFKNIKLVDKESGTELFYLTKENKIRVSKTAEPINGLSKPRLASEKTKFKVLIVDDSKTIRNILTKLFSSDPELEVCAAAERPSEVEELIKLHKPDVITLDIHMPEMDGVSLLKKIAPIYHIPTVMITSISMAEGPMVLEALENGAIDYIQKPEVSELSRLTPMILEKVKMAAKANIQKKTKERKRHQDIARLSSQFNQDSLILLGSSTGGTEAIRDILTRMPSNIPPMLIVQHIPAVFSLAFAKRMNELCPFEVKEAEDGDEVKRNRVLIAPGGTQMKLETKGGKSYVRITDDEPVNRFKPSVDYMFLNSLQYLPSHAMAVILTGMGRDGAKGMLELRKKGVRTIAQNEETCVVFGMPKEAINIGAAEFIEPLDQIAEKLVQLSNDIRDKSLKKSS